MPTMHNIGVFLHSLLEINITIIQVVPLTFTAMGETFLIKGLQFNASSFLIFALDVSLTVFPKPGSGLSREDVACAVVFLDWNYKSVLASNPIRYNSSQQRFFL